MSLDRRLRDLALATRPEFFVVTQHFMATASFLKHHGPDITFILFGEDCLADPHMDPVGIVGDGAGNRRYLWRNAWYGEYNLNLRPYIDRTDTIGTIAKAMNEITPVIKNATAIMTGAATTPQLCIWKALYYISNDNQ